MRLFILASANERGGNRNPVGLTHLVGCGILLSAITRTFHDRRRPPLPLASFFPALPLSPSQTTDVIQWPTPFDVLRGIFQQGEREKKARLPSRVGKKRSLANADVEAVERFPPRSGLGRLHNPSIPPRTRRQYIVTRERENIR